MARGIKDEPYSKDAEEQDIEEFQAKFRACLHHVDDPRSADNQTYSFETLIAITLCAVIAGANAVSDIHAYSVSKREWLGQWLDMSMGTPCYTVFWWLLVRMDPAQSERMFRNWIDSLTPADLREIVAIDGKRVRGASKKRPKSLLHMVSAWSSARGLILGQLKTEEKSNEITAIPELIDSLDVEGAVVSSDSMGCQTAIVDRIIEKGADYVIGLKGNQQSIHNEVRNYFEQAQAIDFQGTPIQHHQTLDKGHGRIEERNIYVTNDISWLPMKSKWRGLQSITMIESQRQQGGKTTTESRYYISSLPPEPKRLAAVVRTHWRIENQVHWVLDVTFKEDATQVSTGHAAENLSILRRLSLNILRLDTDKKTSLRAKRKKAGWNNAYLMQILASASVNSF